MLRRSSTVGSAAAATVYWRPACTWPWATRMLPLRGVVGEPRALGDDADGVGQGGQHGAAEAGDGEAWPARPG